MDAPTALTALGGGALLGIAATVLLGLNGRVAGISGIVGGLLQPREDRDWRLAFVVGLVVAGLAWTPVLPAAFTPGDRSATTLMVAGLLVGFGTRLGVGPLAPQPAPLAR